MDVETFESVDSIMLESRPRPINLSLGWTEILAGIVVLTTALVLDFMAFRVSLLKKEQSAALKEQEQAATSSPSPPSETPGSGAEVAPSSATASTSNSSNGDGNGRGVAAAAAGLPVRPQRRPLSTAEQNRVHLKRAAILASWILGAVVCHRVGLTGLARLCAAIGSFVVCLPHLLRSSKYRRDWALGCLLEEGDKRRSITDMLVWTSFVYMVPSIYGLHVHQYGIALLQLVTTVGSTLFHLTRETKFFNLDNIFATSLLITTSWGFLLAVKHQIWWYVVGVAIGGPFPIFCIVRCGMPGLVCQHASGHGLCRKSNPDYDFFHMLWHLSSGIGTLVTIHYFEVYFPAKEAGGGWFHFFPDVPVVPTVSLAVSAAINFYGNHCGLMPLA